MPLISRPLRRNDARPHYMEVYGSLGWDSLQVFMRNLGSQEHNHCVYAALYWAEYERNIEGWTEYLLNVKL